MSILTNLRTEMITLLRCMLALAAAFLLPLPTIAANVPPVFNAVTNRYAINGGVTIAITNTATDADVPAQSLTYSLLSAPLGATINAV